MAYNTDELIEKFGGTFRFTTLLIRRTKELAGGMQKLCDIDSNDPIEIAIEEFGSGKITVDDDEEKRIGNGT